MDPLLEIVVLFSCAWLHDEPSAGPVVAGSTGWLSADGSPGMTGEGGTGAGASI